MLVDSFKVDSPAVKYAETHISSTYNYQHTEIDRTDAGEWVLKPQSTRYEFRTSTEVPKLG